MKAALLSHLASPEAATGAERSLALLASGLATRGHEVSVTAPGGWTLSDEIGTAGVSVASVPVRSCWLVQYGSQPLWRQFARAVRYAAPDPGARELRNWLAGLNPDVAHVNCLPHLRGAAAARALGLPVVWHIREMLPPGPRRRWFARRLRADATRIVAVSRAVASWLDAEGLGELVEIVHNGVDHPDDVPDQDAARDRFGLPSEATVVGLFSQLVAHKGALDLVRAAHASVREHGQLHFLIAGHGPSSFAHEVHEAISNGPAAKHIHVVPPQKEIWELMAAIDVLSLTTLWPDPLPRVVMEAMAAGKPVVAYADGGVPEMVVDGETGLLCAPGDVAGLARSITNLAGDHSRRQQLGAEGRIRARELFSVELHVDRMERVLQGSM